MDTLECFAAAPGASQALRVFEGHHRGLKGLIEGVGAAVEACHWPAHRCPEGESLERLRDGLSDLRRFAEVHFAHEEKLMQDVLYPQRAEHVRRHREFLAWLGRLEIVSLEEPRRLRASGPATVLAGWWEAHATGQDHALTEFLCRGGI